MILCCTGPNFLAALFPGCLALKAVTTTVVFPRTQEMQNANVMPKAVWRSMHVHTVGLPMKVRGQRKHRKRENNKKQLSSELLALITGVSLKWIKITIVIRERKAPSRDRTVRTIPMGSVYIRNSFFFGMHSSLLSLDQYSCGHGVQSAAPIECKHKKQRETCKASNALFPTEQYGLVLERFFCKMDPLNRTNPYRSIEN